MSVQQNPRGFEHTVVFVNYQTVILKNVRIMLRSCNKFAISTHVRRFSDILAKIGQISNLASKIKNGLCRSQGLKNGLFY